MIRISHSILELAVLFWLLTSVYGLIVTNRVLHLAVDFGSWFTYMKNWEKEMKNHPELPFLTVMYEDLKEVLIISVVTSSCDQTGFLMV